MKFKNLLFILFLIPAVMSVAQDSITKPVYTATGTLLGISAPLRDIPAMSQAEFDEMVAKANEKLLNPKLRTREYPYAATAQPKGPDGVWQRTLGNNRSALSEPILNFQAQTSPYFPPDECGAAGPNHFMQAVNTTYAIYSKTGQLLAGPTNMNQLFGSVPGANCNDGDPIILYDQMADRWFAAEFSLCGNPDRMLIAISTTNDPTGTWYQYSFNMGGMPDYEKFGIWPDGYYMGTNTSNNTDIYVFQREVMLNGGTNPKMVAFDNPWRPGSVDGFMMVPPVDNDGLPAPAGQPGIFIAHQDDAFGGTADQLWIYELAVDWTTTANSTFTRVQQINVEPFDSNFGNNWNNIKQPNTSQELDAIPQVIMNVPQYRNFGSYQSIVCCHTVDVDATDHAGIRWYELRKTSGDWTIRQQGTFAPDQHSRWMGSIMLNGANEIGLGYSISSNTVFPGIRYTGQTAEEYANASGIMDAAEGIIWEGTASQTGANRWGDYSQLSVDPVDDETFWYTNQYVSGGQRTRIASFSIGPLGPTVAFSANNTLPCVSQTVNLLDNSTGAPTSWNWSITPNTVTYVDGTSASSQHPKVQFNALGSYSVSLTATNSGGSNSLTKENFIVVNEANANFTATPLTIVVNNPVIFSDASTCDVNSWEWNFGEGAEPATASGPGPHSVVYTTTGGKTVVLSVNGGASIMTRQDYITVIPDEFNMTSGTIYTCNGTFYDAGGPSQNYSNNSNQTLVFVSTIPGNQIRIDFTEFELESSANCGNDFLSVHNGMTPFAPQLGKWCGTDSPGTLVSDNASGALTFVFRSNSTGTFPGWNAIISCFSPVASPMNFTAAAQSDTEVSLQWQKNAEDDDVLIVWSDGAIGYPSGGTSYEAGTELPGGGTVLYAGPQSSFNHTGLITGTTYYYKAFSYTSSFDYSEGVEASATTITAPPALAVEPRYLEVESEAGTAAFTVSSNSIWNVASAAGWFTVSPSGGGNGVIEVVYEANPVAVIRSEEIIVSVEGLDPVVVTLTQAGAAPLLAVTPAMIVVGAGETSAQLEVSSNALWTVTTDSPDWLTVTPEGMGDGIISATFTQNDWAEERVAIITIATEGLEPVFVSLVQEAAEASLAVTPSAISVDANAGNAIYTVASNFSWSAVSNASWVSVGGGSGTGDLTAVYEANLTLDGRNAQITVSGAGLEQTVELMQEAGSPMLEVNPGNIEVDKLAGSVQIDVISNTSWTAAADSAWLSVTPEGTGNGTITASYQANPYSGQRQSVITVSAEGAGPRTIIISQSGTGLGVDENDRSAIRIYPNPAREEFIVEVNPADFPAFELQLLSLAGTEILSGHYSGQEKYIVDISSVNPGSYMIRIRSGEKMVNRILLIMK